MSSLAVPAILRATPALLVVLYAFHASMPGAAVFAAVAPTHEITVPFVPDQNYALPLRGISAGADGHLLLVSGVSAPIVVDYDPATATSRLVAGNVSSMIPAYAHHGACDFNETHKADTPENPHPPAAEVPFSAPLSIDAIGGEGQQVIVGNSMPTASVYWLGRTSPFSAAQSVVTRRIAGQRCYYVQREEEAFINDIGTSGTATLARHFPPISSVKYRPSTGELFVAFDRTIAIVATGGGTGTIAHWFGQAAPLPSPEPAPYDNTTTVIPVTKPPMKASVDRLSAVSGGIGHMSILNDEFLVVPETLNAGVRLVRFTTGEVTPAVGTPNGTQYAPEYPCLDTPAGCPANNFSVYGAFATATYGATGIFVSGRTFPNVLFVNTATGTVRLVAGRTPQAVVTGAAGMDVFRGVNSLALINAAFSSSGNGHRSNLLIVSSFAGLFYINVSDVDGASSVAPAAPANTSTHPTLCGVWSTCNGHASSAYGTPMTGCTCVCKRGWTGPRCEQKPVPLLTKTKSLSLSHPSKTRSLDLPLPVKARPQPPAEPVAVATVAVTTTIAGVTGTPTVATQGGRATVLLNLQVCDIELGEPLEFAESPTYLAVGKSDLRYVVGAVIGNYVALGGVLAIQYLIVMLVQWRKHLPLLEAQAFVRFPSIGAFPLLFVAEGTAYASALLLRHGSTDVSVRILGLLGLGGLIAITVVFAVFMKVYFRATYELYPEAARRMQRQSSDETAGGGSGSGASAGQVSNPLDEHDQAMAAGRSFANLQSFTASNPELVLTKGTLFERLQSLGRWLLDVKGKWRETGTYQTKRFGGLFMDYRPGMQAFALAELSMAIATGALAAMKPLHCRSIIVLIMLLYVILFLMVLILQPADNRYTKYMMMAITGLQALSSVLILAADVLNSASIANTAQDVLFASMFVVGIMSFIDAATRLYHIGKYIARTKGTSRRVANATFIGEGEMPLLHAPRRNGGSSDESMRPLQQQRTPAGGPEDTMPAGSILSHPTPLSQPENDPLSPAPARGSAMPARGYSAADFTNFSFTAQDVTPPSARQSPHIVVTGAPAAAGANSSSQSALRTPTPANSGGMGSPSPSNTSFATRNAGVTRQNNQTLEQLRAELDDLLTGRTQQSARLDELLEAARAESSSHSRSSGSAAGENNSSIGRHRRSTSNLTAALTTPSTDRPPRYPSNRSLAGFAEALVRGNSTDFAGTSSGTTTSNTSLVRRRGGAGGPEL